VTLAATAPPQAALAFDQMAKEYDEVFTRSMIGRAQRNAVWSVLLDVFPKGSHLLEVNCGTGEDALFLARNGISVTACDASSQMIEVASMRIRNEAPGAPVSFNHLSTERIRELRPTAEFNGAFSNFSGLNCVADLEQTGADLASLLQPNAPLLLCLSTRFCAWETVWYSLHGKFRKAFRRWPGHATARSGEYAINVYYPTVRKLESLFSPFFVLRSISGVGVTVPPSYVEPWIREHPRLLHTLRAIDERLSLLPGFRILGDHMLLLFDRVPV
jgi:ubiquinone/menaquinone biosynthesis C-methylase UbiE